MKSLITMSNGSSSTLYGNISQALKEFIITKFPEEYFNYISVSSELASVNMRRLFGKNSNSELKKREKPYLLIQPLYGSRDNDWALQRIPMTMNNNDLEYGVDPRYLLPAIQDDKYGYALKYKLNRDRVEFDVNITVSTQHQQLDIYNAIKNQILWEFSGSRKLALEAVIPKNIIHWIGKVTNMDVSEKDEYIPILLERLNATSLYPITYRIRNASSRDEYFMYYTHDVIITFSELSMGEGNRKNMIADDFPITFKVTAEFNLPGVFFLEGEREIAKDVEVSLVEDTRLYGNTDTEIIPLFTLTNIRNRFENTYNGIPLYSIVAFHTEQSDLITKDDVDIGNIFSEDISTAIKTHQYLNIDITTLIDFRIYKDAKLLEWGNDFEFDISKLKIIILNPDKTATYRMGIYVNMELANAFLTDTLYDRPYYVSDLQDNKFTPMEYTDYDVLVHSEETGIIQVLEDTYYEEYIPPEVDPDEVSIIYDDPNGLNEADTFNNAILEPKKKYSSKKGVK